jgi:hypothetical protein
LTYWIGELAVATVVPHLDERRSRPYAFGLLGQIKQW